MRLVIFKLSFIYLASFLGIYTLAICFASDELTLVDVLIRVNELSFALDLISYPLPFVLGPIWPRLSSKSMLYPNLIPLYILYSLHATIINGTSLFIIHFSLVNLGTLIQFMQE